MPAKIRFYTVASRTAKDATRDPFRNLVQQSSGRPLAKSETGSAAVPRPAREMPPALRRLIRRLQSRPKRPAAQAGGPKKLPVPSPQVQRELLLEVGQQLPAENASVKLDERRLCKWLYDTAFKPASQPDKRFVCLRRVSEIACGLGEAAMMFRAVDAIEAEFEIDADDVQDKFRFPSLWRVAFAG